MKGTKETSIKEQETCKKENSSIETPAANKMTIYEYEEKYVKRENVRGAKRILKLLVAALAIIIIYCLFNVTLKLWEVHTYAGIAGAVISVPVFVFLFVVPTVKIFKSDYFTVNVNSHTANSAKKHNKAVRKNIAEKIIDFNKSVDGAGWYDDETVNRMEAALISGDDQELKLALTQLYSRSVKKSVKSIILNCALKSATYSALSQEKNTDAALVTVVNFQMIKDIVFLYGFRPSDAKLVKIFGKVLQNSLIAYGLGGVNIGNGVVKTMGDAVKGIPVLGNAISTIVDSSVQGLTNGTLTAVIGYQTIKYLNSEYRLQDILDGVQVTQTETDFSETCDRLKLELKTKKHAA